MNTRRFAVTILTTTMVLAGSLAARADDGPSACRDLPSHSAVAQCAQRPRARRATAGSTWTCGARSSTATASSARWHSPGDGRGDQWPGSRVISAQKANTANAFSLPHLALSTANLFTAVQPGGSLFGLQASNPVDTGVAYGGNAANFGRSNDPMVGGRIGGVNVFGGGLPLYNSSGRLVGALGVSGDSSCADHNIAWRTRNNLNLDYVPAGVSGDDDRPDNIVYDITPQAGQMPA